MAVRGIVYGMGLRYRLHVSKLPGKPDLVISRLKKIIEVKGCFWHQHPGCIDSHIPKTRIEYWKPKLERNVSRDARNLAQLRKCGWKVLVVWECQTKDRDKLHWRLERFFYSCAH